MQIDNQTTNTCRRSAINRMTVGGEMAGNPLGYTDCSHTNQLHQGVTHEKNCHSEPGRARRHQTTRLASRSSHDCRRRPADINPWAISRDTRTTSPASRPRNRRPNPGSCRSKADAFSDDGWQRDSGHTPSRLWLADVWPAPDLAAVPPPTHFGSPGRIGTRTIRTRSLAPGTNEPHPFVGIGAFTSHPLRHGFSAWLRSVGEGWGICTLSQFGPDFAPIVRAQVPAHDLAAGGLLDCGALVDWHASLKPVCKPLRRNGEHCCARSQSALLHIPS